MHRLLIQILLVGMLAACSEVPLTSPDLSEAPRPDAVASLSIAGSLSISATGGSADNFGFEDAVPCEPFDNGDDPADMGVFNRALPNGWTTFTLDLTEDPNWSPDLELTGFSVELREISSPDAFATNFIIGGYGWGFPEMSGCEGPKIQRIPGEGATPEVIADIAGGGTVEVSILKFAGFLALDYLTITFEAEGAQSLMIEVQVKPGEDSGPASINLRAQGVIPVALLGSPDFDVEEIDLESLRAGPDAATPRPHPSFEDVNGSGHLDIVAHFPTAGLGLTAGSTELCVSGRTTGGTPFNGCDAIRSVSAGRR